MKHARSGGGGWLTTGVLVCLALGLAVGGCARGAKEAGGGAPAKGGILSSTGETLRILTTQVEVDDRDYNKGAAEFPILAKVEEITGVKLRIEAVDSSDYGNVLLPRIAAKADLPDMFVQGGGFDIVKYAADGVIIPLDEYIDRYGADTKRVWAQFPDIVHDTTAPDGRIYGYPGRVSPYDNSFNILGMGYRLDWVRKAGVKEPDTIEDWYTMLKAFRSGDLNGNGKADEIPFLAGGNNLNCFSQSWGLSAWNDWWSVTAGGKVLYDWSSQESRDKAKDYLATMNRWFREKLIDQEFLVEHGDKMAAEIVAGIGGAAMRWTAEFEEYNREMKRDDPGVHWVVAWPPAGPQGDRGSEQYGPVNNERWMVTTAARNPALAVKWLDFMFASEQGQELRNWGIEGLSYTVKNGKKVYTEAAMSSRYGAGNVSAYLSSLGGSRWPWILTREAYAAQMTNLSAEYLARLDRIARNGWFRRGFYFSSIPSLKSESDALTTKLNDIRTYQGEMLFKFVVGTEPLSRYDAFVAQLRKLGIDEVVRIKQTQYDRFVGRK